MKIAVVTGSYPPETCGIGDYTGRLAASLTRLEVAVEVVRQDSWHLGNLPSVVRAIRLARPDVVHIQYPTAGFGWHLTPQFLSLIVPSVVTLHEVSEAHLVRKLSLYPFSLRSDRVIFTTSFERDYAVRRAPWIAKRTTVIPIGSNIVTGREGQERSLSDIVYFGFFRPRKGIEEVLELSRLIQERKLPFRVRMIGKPFPVSSPYFEDLLVRSRNLPVDWDSDLDDLQVADLLSRTAFAYMPFPDGASGRRGSLLALLANGVATLTTRGPQTPSSLEGAVQFVESPHTAINELERLKNEHVLRESLSSRARSYASQFTWESIALRHIELYNELLSSHDRRGQRVGR